MWQLILIIIAIVIIFIVLVAVIVHICRTSGSADEKGKLLKWNWIDNSINRRMFPFSCSCDISLESPWRLGDFQVLFDISGGGGAQICKINRLFRIFSQKGQLNSETLNSKQWLRYWSSFVIYFQGSYYKIEINKMSPVDYLFKMRTKRSLAPYLQFWVISSSAFQFFHPW